MKTGSL